MSRSSISPHSGHPNRSLSPVKVPIASARLMTGAILLIRDRISLIAAVSATAVVTPAEPAFLFGGLFFFFIRGTCDYAYFARFFEIYGFSFLPIDLSGVGAFQPTP